MAVLSKLGTSSGRLLIHRHVEALLAGRNSALGVTLVRHGGHEHLFKRRQGQLTWNRFKDRAQFYWISIGFWPCLLVLAYTHIVYGNCELADYPTEGPPPHTWEFERTPLRRFFNWLTGYTDMQYLESNMSLLARCDVKNRWRVREKRVKHLQKERQDYKGYYYHPLTNEWVEHAKKRAAHHQAYMTVHGNTSASGGDN